MPYTKEYMKAEEERKIRKERGQISIKSLDARFKQIREAQGMPVKVGELTPFTGLRIIK